MSHEIYQTLSQGYQAHGITTVFLMKLGQANELALAINLQGKHAVQLETTPQGIFCETWLAARNAQHESHRRLDCFYLISETAYADLSTIVNHLESLLIDSTGGAQ